MKDLNSTSCPSNLVADSPLSSFGEIPALSLQGDGAFFPAGEPSLQDLHRTMAAPMSHLPSHIPTTSPNSSFTNLSYPNLSDPSLMSSLTPGMSAPIGTSQGTIVTAAAAGMSTPPPTAPAQLFSMPAQPNSGAWQSTWPGSALNAPTAAQTANQQLMAAQFTYHAQAPRLDAGYPNMAANQRLAIDAPFGNYPAAGSVYHLSPAQKMPRRGDFPCPRYSDGIPVNKVRGDGRKCRKVYGMENKDKWCTQCRWKKACVRFVD